MLKNKFPPQLELISEHEINMGIRELSEGKQTHAFPFQYLGYLHEEAILKKNSNFLRSKSVRCSAHASSLLHLWILKSSEKLLSLNVAKYPLKAFYC